MPQGNRNNQGQKGQGQANGRQPQVDRTSGQPGRCGRGSGQGRGGGKGRCQGGQGRGSGQGRGTGQGRRA